MAVSRSWLLVRIAAAACIPTISSSYLSLSWLSLRLMAVQSTDEKKRGPNYSKNRDLWYPIQVVSGCVRDTNSARYRSPMIRYTGMRRHGVSSHGGHFQVCSVVKRILSCSDIWLWLLAFAFSTFATSCRQCRARQSQSTPLPHPQKRLSSTLSLNGP